MVERRVDLALMFLNKLEQLDQGKIPNLEARMESFIEKLLTRNNF